MKYLVSTQYVESKYKSAVVVFDGYRDHLSTKDCTHTRRSRLQPGVTVEFDLSMKLQTKKEVFLSNPKNKQRFINMLGTKLKSKGCVVHHARGDADVLIVDTAIAASSGKDTVVIADDTDILALLIYNGQKARHSLWFQPNQKKDSKKGQRCWYISATSEHLGNLVCDNILFLHSILGCDTTSRLYGIGKCAAVVRIKNDEFFHSQAQLFMTPRANQMDVIQAGEKALLKLYNGHTDENLNELRLRKFCDKSVNSTKAVEPESLPPTKAAAKYHSLRVYQQVQVWMGNEQDVPPEQWGWRIVDGRMIPVMTDLPPAPQEFLEVIHCNCKTGCYSLR